MNERTQELKFRETLHGHGARGMYVYEYEDTSGIGIRVEVRREAGARVETKAWRYDWLPGKTFPTLPELRAAMATLSEADIAAEKAKWPQVEVEPEFDESPNRCRLCPREPHTPALHHATVYMAAGHIGHYAGLCDEHVKLASDPAALIAALDEEVRVRKERAAAFRAASSLAEGER